MKELIISEKDPRYRILSEIQSKYPRENLMEIEDDWRVYYFIPPELILEEYQTTRGRLFSQNPIDEWDNWFFYRDAEWLLNLTCHISMQDYFDLLFLHINDKSLRPKCDYCGKPLKFHSIKAGYGGSTSNHNWFDSETHCCSNSCATSLKHDLGILDRSVYNLHHDPKIGAYNDMNRFLEMGEDSDECYFYITWTNSGKFKYGVTSNPNYREWVSRNLDQYKNTHIVLKDNRVQVAYLEARIKLALNIRTEYLDPNETRKFFQILKEEISNRPIEYPF